MPAADASDGAPGDAESDASSEDAADAAGDARGDAGCFTSFDCREGVAGQCNLCPWPIYRVVCISGQCVCACGGTDGGQQ